MAVVDFDTADPLGEPPSSTSSSDPASRRIGGKFYRAIGNPEVIGPGRCPFTSAVAAGPHRARCSGSEPTTTSASRSRRSSTAPRQHHAAHRADPADITDESTQQQLKVNAIHKAGDELADLTPEELAEPRSRSGPTC